MKPKFDEKTLEKELETIKPEYRTIFSQFAHKHFADCERQYAAFLEEQARRLRNVELAQRAFAQKIIDDVAAALRGKKPNRSVGSEVCNMPSPSSSSSYASGQIKKRGKAKEASP